MPAKRRQPRGADGKLGKDPLARERALDALHLMRSNSLSLSRAAKAAHTTPDTVRKHVGKVVVRNSNGRYSAKASDRLTRRVFFLTETGKLEVSVRGSRQASRVARHMAAVDRYLKTGDTDALAVFEGQKIRSRGEVHPFLTDTQALDRLANVGEVSFERLYARRA